MAALPTGQPTTQPFPSGTNPPNPPPLPGSGTIPVPPVLPAFWADAARIAADMMELYARDPNVARQLWDFCRFKLAEMRAAGQIP